jgi:DNA polymerase-3 subunit delta'
MVEADEAAELGYNRAMPWDLIGHRWAVDVLRQHVVSGRMRHAYLLTGPEGVGKRTLALRFAQALSCSSPPAAGEMCGTCRACRLIPRQVHPDLHVIMRGEGETLIKIDAIRALQRYLALAPLEGRWRIALLVGIHEASQEAQNALLKTLEEPAAQVILLLTAATMESVLPTIASRCEVIALRPLGREELAEGLGARDGSAEDARFLSAVAGGRPGVALRLAAEPGRLERRARLLDDLQLLLASNRVDQFAYVHDLVASGREVELETKRRETIEVLETWLSLMRDAMLRAHSAEISLDNPDREADLARLRGISPEGLVRAVRAVEAALDTVGKNANLQLTLETLVLDLPRLAPATSGGPS